MGINNLVLNLSITITMHFHCNIPLQNVCGLHSPILNRQSALFFETHFFILLLANVSKLRFRYLVLLLCDL